MWPSYIPTRPVTLGGVFTLEGGRPAAFDVRVQASRSMFWAETGEHFESFSTVERVSYALGASFDLPVCDASGWRDAATGSVIDVSQPDTFTHKYAATVTLFDASGRQLARRTFPQFVLPSGDAAVSILDLMVADAVDGELVPVGPEGPQGPAGTVAVGTVTTVGPEDPAAVTNSGDAKNAVLDFSIPQGEPGGKGDPGDDGAPGVIQELVEGENVTIDSTDPARPVVSSVGGGAEDSEVATFLETPGSGSNRATRDLASMETSMQRLGSATVGGPFDRVRALAAGGAGQARVVGLGSSTMAEYLASSTAGWFSRLAWRAGVGPAVRLEDVTATRAQIFANGGASGTTSANFLPADRVTKVQLVNPDIVLVMVGSNDAATGVTTTTYKSRMRTALTSLEAAAPNATIVLVHQQGRSAVSRSTWTAYGVALREVADEDPARRIFFDVNRFGDVLDFTTVNRFGLMGSDKTHLTDAGHGWLADVVGTLLGIPAVSPGESFQTVATTGGTESTNRDVASVTLPAVAWPRYVSASGAVFLRVEGTGSGTVDARVYINDAQRAYRALADGSNENAVLTLTHYVPAGEAAVVRAEVRGNGRSVYVSSSAAYSSIDVTSRPA